MYEYDDDGRLARAVTTREPEWRSEDLDMALAAFALDREPVGSHGHRLLESTSPLADPNNPHGQWFYRPGMDGAPIVDHARVVEQRMVEAYKAKHKDADMAGLTFIVERVER